MNAQIYLPDEETRQRFKEKASLHPDWLQWKFLEMCQNGHLKLVEYLFFEFPTYNFNYEFGLEKACESGNIQLIQLLMDKILNPLQAHYLEFFMKSIIIIACQHNHFHVLEYIVKTNKRAYYFDKCSKEGIRYLLNRGYYFSISNSPYREILIRERRKRIEHVTLILKDDIWTLQNFPLLDLNIIKFILIPYIQF
jgi:hypothetical protein